ncbi:MAG: ABC transporter permease [Planctomycetota bacterium]|jgi:hypothetical protein
MNTAIATRLLWKEYRQQRNLWIALLFGATLLQVIFWYFIEQRPDKLDELLPLHLGVAVAMTGFFAVCSASISFAIEREEGTHLRLVSLSCPAGATLAIKFLAGVLGTILLFVASGSLGVSLTTGFARFGELLSRVPGQSILGTGLWAILVVGGGQTVGAFCSLIFRKVLPAVICAVVGVVIGYSVLGSIWAAEVSRFPASDNMTMNRNEFIYFTACSLTCVFLVGAVDFLLVRWWMNRGFSESPRVRSRSLFRRLRVQRDGLDGSVTLEIGGADRAEFDILTPDQARILPPPRLGLSLLYNNWGRGRARALRFLCWKEMAESRRLFLAFLAGGIVLALYVAGAMLPVYWVNGNPQYQVRNEFAFLVMYGFLTMFVCGLMTFRGEQSGDSYQLLSNRGVTPGYVWLSKHLVWFSRLLLIYVVMLAVIAAITKLDGANQILWILFGGTGTTGSFAVDWSKVNWMGGFFEFLTHVAVLYSIAQMASLTWRRAALSIFFALLCSILMGLWMGTAAHFETPMLAAALPLAPALLLMTRLRTRGWLIGDDRFKRWLLPGAVGFLGIVTCWFSTAAWRVFEIPTAQPIVATKALDDGSTVETINGLTKSERAAVLAPVSDEEKATAALYEQSLLPDRDRSLAQILRRLHEIDEKAISNPAVLQNCPPETRAEMERDLSELFEAADRIRDAAASESWAASSPGAETLWELQESDRRNPTYQASILSLVAERHSRSGQPDKALELHRDILAIARHSAGRGSQLEYNQWRVTTDATLKWLIEWSESEDVTPELVDEAVNLINKHHAKSPNPFAVSLAHHQIIRNTLSVPFDELLTLLGRNSHHYNNDDFFWDYATLKFPGTAWRISRLIDWYETRSARLIAEAQQFDIQGIRGGQNLGNWYRSQLSESTAHYGGRDVADYKRWLQTTPIPGHILNDVGLSIVFVDANAKTNARGAQIAMRLHQARRESGKLPATLDELGLSVDVIADPWSGKPMQWFPEGLPNAIESTGRKIPAHTPLLFCGAASGAWLEEVEVMVQVDGPFDPPAQIIPLQQNGQAGADTDAAGINDGLGQDNATTPQGQTGGDPQAEAGQLGFGFDEGAMGSGMAPSNVRWEAQRQFVLRRPDSSQSLQLTPIFWLISTETPEGETTGQAN